MCVIEAFTREVPWGRDLSDLAVVRGVEKRKIPNQPEELTEQQWEAVTKMCAFDPDERMTLEEAIESFKRFVHEEDLEEYKERKKTQDARRAEAS